ncbi:protein PAT1 homolog 2 isoform X1 [Tachysurus fulvidraco]|uniref:protein PAT1 homolog 2 isoform X1 n=1 Tax=Tachysurus fulvidraco TaxID=1234273 RepID=UPI000F4F1ACA|nr:protein PAT1 homolog 2 isoform X1 [Tachysurus fulvidraco]
MSDSVNPEEKGDPDPEASWPENGDQWSDKEDGGEMEDSTLIQEMVEEDEDIDLYNEETFGLDLNAEDLEADPVDILLMEGNHPSSPHPPPLHEPSPPRPKGEIEPQIPAGLREKIRSRRERAKGQLLDDPAVMRTVEGPPSLKSLDSAIVDCGRCSGWGDLNANMWMMSPYGPTRQTPFLQDKAIVRVIDRSSCGRMPFTSPTLRSPLQRAVPQQVPVCPAMPRSPLPPQSPFAITQRYNQPGVYLSPSTPRFHSPKMMPLQFGPNSPRPGPCFSPLPSPLPQRFRFPVLATQLHPQHKRLLSQRPQGLRRKQKDWDHYAELMSAKEKEWIIKLQMIQLQSENLHQDDYYYQEYYRRLETKLAEEEMLGDRSKREPPKLTTPYINKTVLYTPVVHIEGSLGQVAVSTCYSPRRAIDAVHGHTVEEQKDIRQQRLEVLNTIEKCYIILLGVEEAERLKASVSDEEERQRRLKTVQRGVEQISNQLRNPNSLESTEEFLPCLLVSKGKKLLARLLPFLSHDASLQVLRAITTHLPVLMSRDVDEALPVLYPSLRAVIGTLTFTQLVSILQDFTTALPDSTDSRLMLACQNKFGLSLLYALLSQGERLLTADVPMEPSIGDFENWTDTVFHVARQLSRSSLIEPLCMPSNLLTLFCRYLDKRTVQQLKNNMESSTGYLAVGS